MITNDFKNEHEIACDSCSTGYEGVEAENFTDANEQVRALGWKTGYNGGEWTHTCPDCAGE